MRKQISKLKNHFIVCGSGETGRPLVDELIKNRQTVVLIEQAQSQIDLCLELVPVPYVLGDATEDETLLAAGIKSATGVITCLPSDKDNLYITMTARMLSSNVRIISRITDPKLAPKLLKAGADRTVSPNYIGALRMASEIIRPTVVDFLDNMLRSRQGTLRINQIIIPPDSGIAGKMIKESGLKDKYGLLVLGSKEDGGEIHFNPSACMVVKEGMSLIVMGEVESLEQAKRDFSRS